MNRLIEELQHPLAETRWRAASEVSAAADQDTVRALCAALSDTDGRVRRHAAAALGRLDVHAAVERLTGLLNDRLAGVREQAAISLGRIGNAGAVTALHSALQDDDAWVRSRAAEALGRIGSAESFEPLLCALNDSDRWVQGRAAEALGRLKNREAVPLLIGALDRPDCHSWVASALGELGDLRAVPALAAAFQAGEPALRLQCTRALGRLAEEEGIATLVVGLGDADPAIRLEAARGLERSAAHCPALGLRAALPPLGRHLQPWSAEGAEAREACLSAARRIEAVTGKYRQVPVTAGPPKGASQSYPYPILQGPFERAIATTPLPGTSGVALPSTVRTWADTSARRLQPVLAALRRWRVRT